MKDYSMGTNLDFITNYEIKDNKIYQYHDKSQPTVIEYSIENEKQILETMKLQVLNADVNKIFSYKPKFHPMVIGMIPYATMVFTNRIINGMTTQFTKIVLCLMALKGINYQLICFLLTPLSLSITTFLLFNSLFKLMSQYTKGLDYLKNNLFVYFEEEFSNLINQSFDEYVKLNPDVLQKINEDINIENINLNSIDKLKDEEVQKILLKIMVDAYSQECGLKEDDIIKSLNLRMESFVRDKRLF